MKKVVLSVVLLVVLAVGGAAAYRQFVLLPQIRESVEDRIPGAEEIRWRNEHIITPWAFNSDTLYCGEVAVRERGKPLGEYRIFERLTNGHVEFYETWSDPTNSPACSEYADLVPWWWLRW